MDITDATSMPDCPSIMIADRANADALCVRAELPIRAVISVVDAGERCCFGFERIEHRLCLEMDDASGEAAGPGRYSPLTPTREHAAQVIAFAREIHEVGGVVLCHCNAGLSRSPAAALICLAVWLEAGGECEAAERVFRLRPGARPRADLVRFADDLLGRNGALVAALAHARR